MLVKRKRERALNRKNEETFSFANANANWQIFSTEFILSANSVTLFALTVESLILRKLVGVWNRAQRTIVTWNGLNSCEWGRLCFVIIIINVIFAASNNSRESLREWKMRLRRRQRRWGVKLSLFHFFSAVYLEIKILFLSSRCQNVRVTRLGINRVWWENPTKWAGKFCSFSTRTSMNFQGYFPTSS